MRKFKMKHIALALMAATAFSACDSYLDKQPSASSNASIKEASQLISLYDYVTNTYEYCYTDAYSVDDMGIPMEMFDSRPNAFSSTELCFYALASDVMASTSSNNTWQYEYEKIFTANTMISNANSVNGTEAEKNLALCNGYFMRAWSMFRLATVYCLPYSEANREKLGLPMRLGTLFTEDISRATLGETFDQILSDMAEAEKYCAQDKVQEDFAWRTSKCAIYGLYARIYLYMNDYDNAKTYVDKALALTPGLFDYNNLTWGNSVEYAETSTMPAQTLEYCETNSWNLAKIYKWKEWIYIRLQYLGTQWYSPSQDLLDCYDDKANDLRYQYSYIEHGNRRFSVSYDWYRFDPFYDGRYGVSGLTAAELLLMKAELQARSSDWSNALATLTPLREARFATGTATALTAASQSDALKQVLKERRRELPFTVRMMDIKRFAMSATTDDDVTISRKFYKVTTSGVDTSETIQVNVKGDDACLAIPIPAQDIENAQGAIEQNPFK